LDVNCNKSSLDRANGPLPDDVAGAFGVAVAVAATTAGAGDGVAVVGVGVIFFRAGSNFRFCLMIGLVPTFGVFFWRFSDLMGVGAGTVIVGTMIGEGTE